MLTLVVALLFLAVVLAFLLGICAAVILSCVALVSAVFRLTASAVAGARRALRPLSRRAEPLRSSRAPTTRARAQASTLLAEGYVAGSLDLPELERRIEATLHASTESELDGACAGLPDSVEPGPGGSPLVAVGIALVLLGSLWLVRVTGGALVLSGLIARGRGRLAVVAFLSGLLALVSLPASLAVGGGGVWGSRSARRWIVSRGILTPR
ncbi:MAG TPA: DUF1707 domain-containing protein [Gaiellaceae bacterium]|nr:DUF1707 domain-containing protein [Gaiellaceae bacterium]